MQREIGTKGVILVTAANIAVCTVSYIIGYVILRLCLKSFGLTM